MANAGLMSDIQFYLDYETKIPECEIERILTMAYKINKGRDNRIHEKEDYGFKDEDEGTLGDNDDELLKDPSIKAKAAKLLPWLPKPGGKDEL